MNNELGKIELLDVQDAKYIRYVNGKVYNFSNIIRKELKTRIIGKEIIYYNEIDSTQKEIWRKIEKEDIKNRDNNYS